MKPHLDHGDVQIYCGDAVDVLRSLPEQSARTCITSPPYFGLRDYGTGDAQIGLENSPDEFVESLVSVFSEVRRVLADDGTVWLNLGDSYAAERGGTHQPAESLAGGIGGKTSDGARVNRSRHDGYNPTRNASAIGLKHKDLIGIPWRVAFALQRDGWYLRSDIIWHKPNPMPESVTDRPTKSHEYIFLLSKSEKYLYNGDAIKEGAGDSSIYAGRNRRSVWTVGTKPYSGAHFAVFPPALITPCVLAGSNEGDTVLDPFMGSGTTAEVARAHGRRAVGVDLNPEYIRLAEDRLAQLSLLSSAE